MTTQLDADVIIVGAGPVGLGLAVELGQRSIRCILVEQNDRVGYNPRAKLTNVRSMELLRRWGVASRLREASPMPKNYPSNIVFATHLNGYPLARFENAFSLAPTAVTCTRSQPHGFLNTRWRRSCWRALELRPSPFGSAGESSR